MFYTSEHFGDDECGDGTEPKSFKPPDPKNGSRILKRSPMTSSLLWMHLWSIWLPMLQETKEMFYTTFGDDECGDGTEPKSFKPDPKNDSRILMAPPLLISPMRISFWSICLAMLQFTQLTKGFPVGESNITTPQSVTTATAATAVPTRRAELSTAGMTKRFITELDGGTLKTNGVTLRFGAGCLSKDTQITMIEDYHNFAFKSLVDLELLKIPPRVLEFLPDGLEFTKSADLTVQLGEHLDSLELFVLHGSYDSEMERTIWKLVTDDIEVNSKEGYVNMKINGFCFYSYILSTRGKIARILSHLNHSFSCHAVALYRRMPASPKIDVAVVLLSEFVESHEDERNSSQLLRMVNEDSFCRSEKGALKRVDTHRGLEICIEFPGKDDLISYSFKVDVPQLDSVGMVLDENNFREIAQEFPARGKVLIYEIHRNNKRLLWTLNITEIEEVQCTAAEVVVSRTTRLSNSEISRLSCCVGLDWDGLAGLLDIPYAEREELRFNVTSYAGFSSKVEVILGKFNKSKSFCRKRLITIVEELERHDLRKEIVSGVPETDDENEENPERPENENGPIENNNDDVVVLRDTPLSSREMYRISRQIVDWERLASLINTSQATKDDIRRNVMYPDAKSRTEKVLSIFNNKKEFCREKLVGFLKEIGKHDLISTVKTGSCRCL